MTAEVCVLNGVGIALAADSAVTIGRDAKKIYTSAEKLFQLSTCAPVGIMIYGNANFLGIPWETIIKNYRHTLGTRRFDHVQDYAANFFEYIRRNRVLFSRKSQDDQVHVLVASFYYYIREKIAKRINLEAEKRDGLNPSDLPPILADIIDGELKEVRKATLLSGFNERTRKTIDSRYSSSFLGLQKEIFGNLPFSTASKKALLSIAVEMLRRKYFGPLKSGIVIAGFGEEEHFPALVAFELEEMILDRPRLGEMRSSKINHGYDALIVPFAQREMVYSFMEGIDKKLSEFMTDSTAALFTGAIASILAEVKNQIPKLGTTLEKKIGPNLLKMLKELFERWTERRKDYWKPVIDVVSSLPKDELAAMAESLVNLTKFRRRVTTVRETVGGPIDVAIITKGDGFVWIKRKHYFDPTLNPRIVARFGMEARK